ncbi:MAG: DinB family protein [Acidobacteria bacterium]|nr:DinB family protein [Acidobacteriota bacterium]
MNIWEHLFLTGEFREREALLSGLTLEQVTLRPDGASHSIYEELWHAATNQRCVVQQDKELAALLSSEANYPSEVPDHEQQWRDLVQEFLEGARAAVELSQTPDALAVELEPGLTMSEELCCLAVHNAYHLGKIVALRQRIGAWPPKAVTEEP